MNVGDISFRKNLSTIVLLGNYLPRQCGIATFTTDLLNALIAESPESSIWALAMNDIPEGYLYPNEVHFEINQNNISEYKLASDFLNFNRIDVVCVQHEYGIFGGKNGIYLLELLRNIHTPIVTTLHTVLEKPTQGER